MDKLKSSSPSLDIKVFYVRISNCNNLNHLAPNHLTICHEPQSPDTVLQVINGKPNKIMNSDYYITTLKRDQVDETASENEATFVSIDTIRLTGSIRFEVFIKDELLLVGVLELSGGSKTNNEVKKWSMRCEAALQPNWKRVAPSSASALPRIEVCVAGCSDDGAPVILSSAMMMRSRRRKRQKLKVVLDPIPECDQLVDEETVKEAPDHSEVACQQLKYQCYKAGPEVAAKYDDMDMEGEVADELSSWFNAGFRVGVGISLGICIGIGIIGVGTTRLLRSYHTTTRNYLKRHVI